MGGNWEKLSMLGRELKDPAEVSGGHSVRRNTDCVSVTSHMGLIQLLDTSLSETFLHGSSVPSQGDIVTSDLHSEQEAVLGSLFS